ncbi:MAG: hypothetical protein FK733_17165 [Asgard group archaeon]|nr:hypothetical protein [Asgard group archaeon]
MLTIKNNNSQSRNSSKQLYVLDASAIYNGILSHNLPGYKFLPECVISEIRDMIRGEALIEEALLYDDLRIVSTEVGYIKKVKQIAGETGDIQELSECDLSVIAVALGIVEQNKSVMIVSDDYDIQNLANYMKIPCRGVHWKGITSIHKYHWVCPACKTVSSEKRSYCLECGTEMKRKTLKKKLRK